MVRRTGGSCKRTMTVLLEAVSDLADRGKANGNGSNIQQFNLLAPLL